MLHATRSQHGRNMCCLSVVPGRRPPNVGCCTQHARNICEGPKRRTREGGSEWEPIKNLLEGDRCSNKMNTASNTRLRLNYRSWPRPRSHWSATGPRNQCNTQPTEPKLTNNTTETCTTFYPCYTVRPMACVGKTRDTGQTGGQSHSGRLLQQPHNKCSRKPQ
jgi:hypothetical protein